MGIEPTLLAWEAKVLPLNYTRDTLILLQLWAKCQVAGLFRNSDLGVQAKSCCDAGLSRVGMPTNTGLVRIATFQTVSCHDSPR